jgi:cell division protein FtsB
MAMRIVMLILLVLLVLLQYKAWFSDVGHFAAARLSAEVAEQTNRGELLARRNQILRAEVLALKRGVEALEARARNDLGMIKEGETFYLVPDDH